jgi:hypothetical protein
MATDIRNMTAAKAYSVRADELFDVLRGLESDASEALVGARFADWSNVADLSRALELATQLRSLLRGELK